MREQIEKRTCDRCHSSVEVAPRGAEAVQGWATASAHAIHRIRNEDGDARGLFLKDADLCPICADGLIDWFSDTKELAPHGATELARLVAEQDEKPSYYFSGERDHFIKKARAIVDPVVAPKRRDPAADDEDPEGRPDIPGRVPFD